MLRRNATLAEGTIAFKTATGSRRALTFKVSAEHERHSYLHDDELPMTLFALQKIPKGLDSLATEIRRLRETFEAGERGPDSPGS